MTYSLLLTDGEGLVAAVASCAPGAGRVVPHVRDGVGAALSQAHGDAAVGREILAGLAAGRTPQAAVRQAVMAAGDAEHRQAAALSLDASVGTHRGAEVLPAAGERPTGDGLVCGNLLANERVLERMEQEVLSSRTADPLLSRAIAALRAAEAAGGDARGRMSAGLRAHGPAPELLGWGPHVALALDVRIDVAEQPLELLADAVAVEAVYAVVAAFTRGEAEPPSPDDVPALLEELVARAGDASAAIVFCREVVGGRMQQPAWSRQLARDLVARHPGRGATEVTVARLWSTLDGAP